MHGGPENSARRARPVVSQPPPLAAALLPGGDRAHSRWGGKTRRRFEKTRSGLVFPLSAWSFSALHRAAARRLAMPPGPDGVWADGLTMIKKRAIAKILSPKKMVVFFFLLLRANKLQ